jgi:hypothetical protein
LSANEAYSGIVGKTFVNEISVKPIYYDFRTKYVACFGGSNGYIYNRSQVLSDLKAFVGNVI